MSREIGREGQAPTGGEMKRGHGAKRHRNAILAALAAAALMLALAVLSSCDGIPKRIAGGKSATSSSAERGLIRSDSGGEEGDSGAKEKKGTARTDSVENGGKAASRSTGQGGKGSSSLGSNSGTSHGDSSGSSSESNSESPGGPKPSHTHDWVAQTENKWIRDSAAWDEQVWVQNSAAWTEKVETGSRIQCSCGATFNTSSEWDVHNREQLITAGQGHRYSVVPTYEQVYHEATRRYETVTTGYKCSGCGAKIESRHRRSNARPKNPL